MAWTIEAFASTFFEPLVAAATDRADLQALVEELGWRIEPNDEQAEAIRGVMAIAEHVSTLTKALPAAGSGPLQGAEVEALYTSITGIVEALSDLGNVDTASLARLPAPLNDAAAWRQMALDIPEYLTVTWLAVHAPAVYEGLHFAGAIVETEIAPDLPPKRTLLWDKLTALLSEPGPAIADTYVWGAAFTHARFLLNLARWLGALGIPHAIEEMTTELAGVATGGTVPAGAVALHLQPARLAGLSGAAPALALVPASRSAAAAPDGVAMVLTITAPTRASLDLGGGWAFSLEGDKALTAPAGLAVDPAGVRAIGPDSVRVGASLAFSGEPVALFDTAGGCRLEITAAAIGAELVLGGGADARVTLALGTATEGGLRLVVAPAAGDSFVAEVLGGGELTIDAGLTAAWSARDGVTIEGGLGFEVIKPLDLVVGPLHVDRIRIALLAGTDGIAGEAAVSGGIDLGVLALVAEDVGIRVRVVPVAGGAPAGPFGSVQLTAGFKPPDGFGIAVDLAGLVSGGGYLAIDQEAGRYAGVAQVAFVELGLTAIGIIETRVPGIDGWSMFFSVFSEFPPIALSFGFTLNGVGGLLGVNRTLDFAALEKRLLTGALDSVMFPEDPVANAPKIIEDLTAVFPPAAGQFLFGVMCKIGWGPRTIVEADLGVIVELPDPVRIALLGQVAAALPDATAPIVELHMDVAGLADLTAGTLALNAVLRDSHIAGIITLSGAMAMRAELLDRPNMLLSVGGFHPSFDPPAGFPALDRVRAQVPVGDAAMVSLAGYVAVTSNTFQTGGRLDVWVELSGFTAEGFIAIDALIEIDPFGFDVRTAFGVSVRAGSVTLMGVEVSARLLGPSPIEIHGEATFEILGFEKTLDLHITTQGRRAAPRPRVNLAALVAAALAQPDALAAEADAAERTTVRLLSDAAGVDPAARLVLSQKVAPLGRTLDHVGGSAIEGARRVAIERLTVNGGAATLAPAREWFAPAQFFTMRDAEKLNSPSFEEMDAGVSVSAVAEVAGARAVVATDYEEIVIDRVLQPKPDRRPKATAVRAAVPKAFAGRFTAATAAAARSRSTRARP